MLDIEIDFCYSYRNRFLSPSFCYDNVQRWVVARRVRTRPASPVCAFFYNDHGPYWVWDEGEGIGEGLRASLIPSRSTQSGGAPGAAFL